ncbi:MAG TPA: polyphosphate kinase 1 [Vicinamibacterales bacterium]
MFDPAGADASPPTPASSSNVAPAASAETARVEDPRHYINRELSWLAFNERVLDQARTGTHPLLERVKFLAIAANNLDEFFMIRVATLTRQVRAGLHTLSPDGLTVEEQLTTVRTRAERMLVEIARCWDEQLVFLLADAGIRVIDRAHYTPAVSAYLTDYFRANVCPVLTPLAFDPGHPFPYISNRSNSFAVVVEDQGAIKFARVKVPDVLSRFIRVPASVTGRAGDTFVFLEDVIRQNLSELFRGAQVRSAHLFRIIRDTDIVLREEGVEDLLESVDRGLKELRHGPITLLQTDADMPERVLNILVENFELGEPVVVPTSSRLGFSDFMSLTRLQRPELRDAPFAPRTLWRDLEPEAIFDRIKYRDQLVHHPFDSFAPVETFIDAAVDDPQVVAIKITLYRIGQNSPIVKRLIEASERGKQVAVLVELKARFDERSNIGWATRLEEAGVHVVYGLVKLKTHCKLCLVVRKEGERIQRYVHIGTGNYNRTTAQVYTDLGLFTANEEIGADASELFNALTGYSRQVDYRALLVAPVALRTRFTALVEREIAHAKAGVPAGIVIKNNSISDPDIVRLLYRASQAGVRVDAIVRGICCLRPGVPGVSDLIRVRSIVGRFLEHSRIYSFENAGDTELYIGSADLMERNLDRRVEALCPVLDPDIRRYLRHQLLQAYLRDDTRATMLGADGRYEPIHAGGRGSSVDAQQLLMSQRPPEA